MVLFWRLMRMLQVTSNALRQQVINNEGNTSTPSVMSVDHMLKNVCHQYGAFLKYHLSVLVVYVSMREKNDESMDVLLILETLN